MKKLKKVYLVDGARTPFLTKPYKHTRYSALDLSIITARMLLLRHSFMAAELDAIIMASSSTIELTDLAFNFSQHLTHGIHHNPLISTLNISGESSGFQALDYAFQQIALDQKQLVLLGGVDTLPGVATDYKLSDWKAQWRTSDGLIEKSHTLSKLHTRHFMDQKRSTASSQLFRQYREFSEKKLVALGIKPAQLSVYAQLSQRRLQYAQRNHLLDSVTPLFYQDGGCLQRDEGVLFSNDVTKTDSLMLLPANVLSVVAEGATMLLLASEDAVERYQLPVLSCLSPSAWALTDTPDQPTTINKAVDQLLKSESLSMNNIGYWEINETSAVDVISAQQNCPENEKIATLSHVNVDGGCLALGNPPAANALRMVLQLAHITKRKSIESNKGYKGVVTSSFSDGREVAFLMATDKSRNKS